MDELQSAIKGALLVLVGKPFWGSARALDMQMFAFGNRILSENRRSEPVEKGEYALHVQCDWRMVRSGKILVGSRDIFFEAIESVPPLSSVQSQTDWTRRDERLRDFFDQPRANQVSVDWVEADILGGVRLGMNDKTVLEVFPNHSEIVEGHSEYWRFLQPGTDVPHVVVSGYGVEGLNGLRPMRPS
jgi:hypothetical protein